VPVGMTGGHLAQAATVGPSRRATWSATDCVAVRRVRSLVGNAGQGNALVGADSRVRGGSVGLTAR